MDEFTVLEEDTYVTRDLPGGAKTRVLVGRAGQRVRKSALAEEGPIAGTPTRGDVDEANAATEADTPPDADADADADDATPAEQPPLNASTDEWAEYAQAERGATEDDVAGVSRAELIERYGVTEGQ